MSGGESFAEKFLAEAAEILQRLDRASLDAQRAIAWLGRSITR